MKKNNIKQQVICFTFILPLLLFFSIAVIIPFFSGINLSFTNWDSIAKDYDYVKFDNYISAFNDQNMWEGLGKSIYFGLFYCIINNGFAIMIAVLINRTFKWNKLAKTLFFIPTCLSGVLAAFIWKFLYSSYFTQLLGVNSLLGNPDSALNAVILIFAWNAVGINIIIYAASLSSIAVEYYEAAKIDGANKLAQFINITIPMLMPAFTVCITLTLTNGMKEFGIVLSSTGGGPINSTKVALIYIYDNIFQYYKAGYGQAMSIIFLLILVVIGFTLSKFFRSREVEL